MVDIHALKERYPQSLKITKINSVSAYVYLPPNKIILDMEIWKGWTQNPTTHQYIANIDNFQVWDLSDNKRILTIPAGLICSRSVVLMNTMGIPVCGTFRRNKGKVKYEFPMGIFYDIPLDTPIEFINDIPVGITGKTIVRKNEDNHPQEHLSGKYG